MSLLIAPLFILSIIGLSCCIERFIFWFKVKKCHNKLKTLLYENNFTIDSIDIRKSWKDLPLCLFASGLSGMLQINRSAKDEFINILLEEVSLPMQKNYDLVLLVTNLGPSLGLLGTIVGLMQSFSGFSLVGEFAKSEVVTSGISDALITTVYGLCISIVGSICLSFFRRWMLEEVFMLEKYASDFTSRVNSEDVLQ